ncbi:MAG: class I SAM-dependent methyltransferase [Microbacterium sp.]
MGESERALGKVTAAYGARADEYIDALGRIEHAADADRALIEKWALGLDGLVLDVGSGPGQWTHLLTRLGVDIEGIDPVAEFVDRARVDYPTSRYRVGRAEALPMEDASLAGVLAWYSLIHTPPRQIDTPLREFARCLRPGGGLAVGFFTGSVLEPFDHAITTAYYWPIDQLVERVEHAGFTVTHTETRSTEGSRPHGAILARRTASGP